MFKVSIKDTRRRFVGFMDNFEHISHIVFVSIIDFEHVNAGWAQFDINTKTCFAYCCKFEVFRIC